MNFSRNDCIHMLRKAIESDRFSDVINIIQYGSNRKSSDIDLLVITKDTPHLQNFFSFGLLDIMIFSKSEFEFLLKNYDPRATEPVLTGSIIYGTKKYIEESISESIKNHNITEIVEYLHCKSMSNYLSSKNLFIRYQETKYKNLLLWSFIDLSYSYSCNILSKLYSVDCTQVYKIDDILGNDSFTSFKELWHYIRVVKQNPRQLSTERYSDFRDKWKELQS